MKILRIISSGPRNRSFPGTQNVQSDNEKMPAETSIQRPLAEYKYSRKLNRMQVGSVSLNPKSNFQEFRIEYHSNALEKAVLGSAPHTGEFAALQILSISQNLIDEKFKEELVSYIEKRNCEYG
jgi:hypothetical protein